MAVTNDSLSSIMFKKQWTHSEKHKAVPAQWNPALAQGKHSPCIISSDCDLT